ncbi:MAG: MerR family DNA-binding transcriptional regulator [Halieaceae bacterium]|jgi:DNA-binding transcriptional MerR regulator|nr:MerR family DNA-binding transcriptional regulator [Halieaceae bacterium]
MPATHYRISELASEFDITPRTIRFYEEKGLLNPERDGQTRLFRPADRVRLALILRGKRCGLSLDESREIIEMYEPGQSNVEQLHSLLDKVRERRDVLTAQLADIKDMMQELDDVERRCRRSLAALEEDNHP